MASEHHYMFALLIGQLAGNESPDRGRLFADDVLQFVAYLDEVSLEFDAVALSPRKPSHNNVFHACHFRRVRFTKNKTSGHKQTNGQHENANVPLINGSRPEYLDSCRKCRL